MSLRSTKQKTASVFRGILFGRNHRKIKAVLIGFANRIPYPEAKDRRRFNLLQPNYQIGLSVFGGGMIREIPKSMYWPPVFWMQSIATTFWPTLRAFAIAPVMNGSAA